MKAVQSLHQQTCVDGLICAERKFNDTVLLALAENDESLEWLWSTVEESWEVYNHLPSIAFFADLEKRLLEVFLDEDFSTSLSKTPPRQLQIDRRLQVELAAEEQSGLLVRERLVFLTKKTRIESRCVLGNVSGLRLLPATTFELHFAGEDWKASETARVEGRSALSQGGYSLGVQSMRFTLKVSSHETALYAYAVPSQLVTRAAIPFIVGFSHRPPALDLRISLRPAFLAAAREFSLELRAIGESIGKDFRSSVEGEKRGALYCVKLLRAQLAERIEVSYFAGAGEDFTSLTCRALFDRRFLPGLRVELWKTDTGMIIESREELEVIYMIDFSEKDG